MKNLLFSLLLLISWVINAQDYGKGLVFNQEEFDKLPKSAVLSSRAYTDLPSSVSLKKYAPTPGNQGNTGTCTAWSSAYHARTISESVRLNRTDLGETNRNTFSPSYVYNQIRRRRGCDHGTSPERALRLMQERGVPKFSDFSFNCDREPKQSDHKTAAEYRISNYKTIFGLKEKNQSLKVKMSLANNYPVVIGMFVPGSFMRVFGDTWIPLEEEYGTTEGGHAMVAVGYDDNKNGGSLLIMNSWGTEWGDGGYIWVPYDVFDSFSMFGAELIDYSPPEIDMEGSLSFMEKSGTNMYANFVPGRGVYQMVKGYKSGTTFQFSIQVGEPSYVYAFGSDLTGQSYRIFPQEPVISPYINYKGSDMIFPGEGEYVQMDDQAGTDYFCVLYSKEPIDYESLLSDMEQADGSFRERLVRILGRELVDPSQVFYEEKQIRFRGSAGEKTIIPVIVEITHL